MRKTKLLVALLLALPSTLVALGCEESEPRPGGTFELVGVIVDVENPGGEVRAFTLRSDDELFEIAIADEVDYGFNLDHLREHLATGEPVRCTVEERRGTLRALTILDA